MSEDRKKFVLGVDLDGVCADFYGEMKTIAAEWLHVDEEELTDDVSVRMDEWGIEEPGGYQTLHRFAVTQRDLFKRMDPIEDAPVTLRRLSEQDIRIRIITHRLCIKFFHQEAVTQTTEWLDYHGIPYWDLCFMRDKSAVGANLYVEDKPENIRALRDNGHETIVFGNSTNKPDKLDDPLDEPRAESWKEAERIILDHKEKWERTQGGTQQELSGL